MQDFSLQTEELSQQAQTAHLHRQTVKTAFISFFSGQPCAISWRIHDCREMLTMNGVASFYTPFPWTIILSDGLPYKVVRRCFLLPCTTFTRICSFAEANGEAIAS